MVRKAGTSSPGRVCEPGSVNRRMIRVGKRIGGRTLGQGFAGPIELLAIQQVDLCKDQGTAHGSRVRSPSTCSSPSQVRPQSDIPSPFQSSL